MDKSIAGEFTFDLHRVLGAWGEGTSNSGDPGGAGDSNGATIGDATWTLRQVTGTGPVTGISWSTPGGDFAATPSASESVNSDGGYTWSGSGLIDDLNAWLATPGSNHGWLLKGPESPSTTEAKRFGSRENSDLGARPNLDLTYTQTAPPAPLPFETFLTTHFPSALTGEFIDPNGDDDGDGIPLQVEHAYGFSPSAFNAASASGFSTAIAPGTGDTTKLTLTFRRMPTATDVTYNLQISGNLTSWTTVATSAAGATATGANGGTIISDVEIGGQAPARLVTVEVTLPSGTDAQFVRLETVRSL